MLEPLLCSLRRFVVKVSAGMIHPVYVCQPDDTVKTFEVNDELTDFKEIRPTQQYRTNMLRCKSHAKWMRERTLVQKSKLPKFDKEFACDQIEEREIKGKKLSALESARLTVILATSRFIK